jgi:hypothetical protein
MRLLIALTAMMMITACGQRQQYAADAIAGVDALERISAHPAQAAPIAAGTRAYVAATAGTAQAALPAPSRGPDAILADPPAYQSQAEVAEQQATAGWWARAAAWTGGVLLAALALLKTIPGAHRPVVTVLDALLSNRADREQQRCQAQVTEAGATVARLALALHPELRDHVPSALRPALDALSPASEQAAT